MSYEDTLLRLPDRSGHSAHDYRPVRCDHPGCHQRLQDDSVNFFNPTALERAQRCMRAAQESTESAQHYCTLARVALEDAGRSTQAAAMEMVCASLEQNQRDIARWKELTAKTRENHGE